MRWLSCLFTSFNPEQSPSLVLALAFELPGAVSGFVQDAGLLLVEQC